jgi:ferrous iron transport protein A
MANQAIALCNLQPNEEGTVVALEGGHGLISRLAALGFTPGATVNVVRNHGHGALIVSVLDTQVAMGRGEASRVQVRPKSAAGGQPTDGGRHRHGRW